MAAGGGGLYDKAAATYLEARPKYPKEWFAKLASLSPSHSLAWDVGTGTGQAALGLAEHYEKVMASDISEELLKHAAKHPQIHYLHSPSSMSNDEVVNLIGGESSVDLITVATAVHWFDLEKFYSLVKRVLKKPGGIIAVWTYNIIQVSPEFDPVIERFYESAIPYNDPKAKLAFDCYMTLPFPFESVGLGSEGEPVVLHMSKEMSFEGLIGLLRSTSAYITAKAQGVELLTQEVAKEFENAWGGPELVRTVIYKIYMIAGKV